MRTGPTYFTKTFFKSIFSHNIQAPIVVYPPRYFSPLCYRASKNEDDFNESNSITPYAIHWFDASWMKSLSNEKRVEKYSLIEKNLTPLYMSKKQGPQIAMTA